MNCEKVEIRRQVVIEFRTKSTGGTIAGQWLRYTGFDMYKTEAGAKAFAFYKNEASNTHDFRAVVIKEELEIL